MVKRKRNIAVKKKKQVSDSKLSVTDVTGSFTLPLVTAKLCRLCEAKDGPFINIFEADKILAKKIDYLMPFVIEEKDELPHKICYRCSAKIEELDDFVRKCVKTQENLFKEFGKDRPFVLKAKTRSIWEKYLDKSNLTNDDICDAVVKKAMEGIKHLNPVPEDEPPEPKRMRIEKPSKICPDKLQDEQKAAQATPKANNSKKTVTKAANTKHKRLSATLKFSTDSDEQINHSNETIKKLSPSISVRNNKPVNKSREQKQDTVEQASNDETLFKKPPPPITIRKTPPITLGKTPPITIGKYKPVNKSRDQKQTSQAEESQISTAVKKYTRSKGVELSLKKVDDSDITVQYKNDVSSVQDKATDTTMAQTAKKNTTQQSADPKNLLPDPSKPFNILDYVSTIKVSGVGKLYQCRLCERNFLKMEVIKVHRCAKQPKPPVPPELPKAPVVKYITTNAQSEPVAKPRPKIGPACYTKKLQMMEASATASTGQLSGHPVARVFPQKKPTSVEQTKRVNNDSGVHTGDFGSLVRSNSEDSQPYPVSCTVVNMRNGQRPFFTYLPIKHPQQIKDLQIRDGSKTQQTQKC